VHLLRLLHLLLLLLLPFHALYLTRMRLPHICIPLKVVQALQKHHSHLEQTVHKFGVNKFLCMEENVIQTHRICT